VYCLINEFSLIEYHFVKDFCSLLVGLVKIFKVKILFLRYDENDELIIAKLGHSFLTLIGTTIIVTDTHCT
jgi:hypothetical protein